MHPSSLENMQKCYRRYICRSDLVRQETVRVIDIGGANVNGSYADIFSAPPFYYQAVDVEPSENVDIVLEDPYRLPFTDNSVDIIICGQVFEHVEFFWKLFEEMCRVVTDPGFILLIVPSAGPVHRYPVDCYRFYPDSLNALARYTGAQLIDSWHDNRGPWKDLVGVFSRSPHRRYEAHDAEEAPVASSRNRYEMSTLPVFAPEQEAAPDAEVLRGKEPYLDVLARIHQTLAPAFYLEIGVRTGNSLKLAVCPAVAVDPAPDLQGPLAVNHQLLTMSSDDFFESRSAEILKETPLDLVFIDGMHLFEFALRDFIHVESYAHPKTVVVVDDVLPNHPLQAERRRQSKAWTGDVWKLHHCLSRYRPDLQMTLLDTYPTGLLLISGLNPDSQVLVENYNPIVRNYSLGDQEKHIDSYLVRAGVADPVNLEKLLPG